MCLEAVFILFNASIPLIITLKTQQQEQERYLFRLSINSLLTSAIFLPLFGHLLTHAPSQRMNGILGFKYKKDTKERKER